MLVSMFKAAGCLFLLGFFTLTAQAADGVLRVCSDPNNMPFSNSEQEGFENQLAQMVADSWGWDIVYHWYPQRRGFIRNTLAANKCDLIMGVPEGFELAKPTDPYYRSSYMFVTRRQDAIQFASLDDSQLKAMRVGVPIVGDDYSSTPGGRAMTRRGLSANLVGYSVYGDYREPHPPSAVIEAVAKDQVDVAIAWGAMADYFAQQQSTSLKTQIVSPAMDAGMPMQFGICMAVRRDDELLREKLNQFIHSHQDQITALLTRYKVTLVGNDRTTQ